MRLWAAETGHALRVLDGHKAGVTGLAFSSGGQLLASASVDGTVRLWGVEEPF